MRLAVLGVTLALALGIGGPLRAGDVAAPVSAAAQPVDWAEAIRATAQVDPVRGERLAEAAEQKARREPPSRARMLTILTAQWLRAQALIGLNQIDEAERVVTSALSEIPPEATNTKLHGDLLIARARIEAAKGRAGLALSDYQRAYRMFVQSRQPRSQAVALMGIGSIYRDAGDFERVLYYYKLAEDAFTGDKFVTLSSLNNQANALADLNRYKEASIQYRRALAIAAELRSTIVEARILNNLASTQIDGGDLAGAASSLRKGLALSARPDAAEWRPSLLATSADLAMARQQPDAAVRLIEAATAGKSFADTLDQSFRDLHETAYRAYKQVGDGQRALQHLEAFDKLDRESRSIVTQASAALLTARFDFVNQNVRISVLKEGQLQRDITVANLRARQNLIILGGLLVVVSIVAVALALYLRALRRSRDAIRAANDELERANQELKHALTAKSRFLATTSHEIRTPLNGVLGMTQVMLADAKLPSETRERIGLMQVAGQTMRDLVDDILEFAKIDAGKVEVARDRVDLHRLLRDVTDLWSAQASSKNIRLTLDLGNSPAYIVEDAQRLRQVANNLLSNAIKFTAHGDVCLAARTQAIDGREELVVTVTDTGIGIDPSAFETIFEMFWQVDTTTTRQFGGTGLGLAISRSIVEALGGSITVASTVGKGTVFTMTLPLLRARAPEALPMVAPRAGGAQNLSEAVVVLVGGGMIAQSVIRNLIAGLVGSVSYAPLDPTTDEASSYREADLFVIVATSADPVENAALVARLRSAARDSARCLLIAPEGLKAVVGVEQILSKPLNPLALVAALRNIFTDPKHCGKQELVGQSANVLVTSSQQERY